MNAVQQNSTIKTFVFLVVNLVGAILSTFVENSRLCNIALFAFLGKFFIQLIILKYIGRVYDAAHKIEQRMNNSLEQLEPQGNSSNSIELRASNTGKDRDRETSSDVEFSVKFRSMVSFPSASSHPFACCSHKWQENVKRE